MGKNQHFGQFVIKERIDTTCYIILFILDLFLENWKFMVPKICISQKYTRKWHFLKVTTLLSPTYSRFYFLEFWPNKPILETFLLKVYCKFLQVFAPPPPIWVLTNVQVDQYFYLFCSKHLHWIIFYMSKLVIWLT